MAYADFRRDFLSAIAGDGARQAQLWNLENETRVPKQRAQFKRMLGRLHGERIGSGQAPGTAALGALDDGVEYTQVPDQTSPLRSKWLGQLPVSPGGSLPSAAETHMSSMGLARYASRARFRPRSPSREVSFRLRDYLPPPGRRELVFLWITFASDLGEVAREDPDAVRCEMGLAHYKRGDYVFRIVLAVGDDKKRYIPTCLDARLYYAWRPPPEDYREPWGLTRDLGTGEPRWPEQVVEYADFRELRLTARLVSPPDRKVPIS